MSAALKLSTVLLAAVITGCAGSYGGTGSRENTVISVQYGTVQSIEAAPMDANVGTGAAVGGALGLAAASTRSTGTQVGVAAAGALIGALVQKQRAANSHAEQYNVRLNAGNTVAIVTEHHDMQVGDCVSVEQGRHANIRRVSPVMCDTMANTSHPAFDEMHTANVAEASECEQVKQEVLDATTEEQVNLAYQKMRALCEH